MKKNKRRRCRHCGQLFHGHPRTRAQQRFCAAPACRAASKKASQQRWLRKPENQDYFRGVQHVMRVQAWRRKRRLQRREPLLDGDALQETIMGQLIEGAKKSGDLALQEMIRAQGRESTEEIRR